jgi:hypothetical protein
MVHWLKHHRSLFNTNHSEGVIMNRTAFFTLFFILVSMVYGQEPVPTNLFEKGKVTIGTKSFEVEKLSITNGNVNYVDKNTSTNISIELGRVKEIKVFRPKSSSAGVWIGTIAGVGLGAGIAMGTKKTESSSSTQGGVTMTQETTTISLWPVYVFGLVGSFVGLAIDSNAGDWETIYPSK